MKNTRKTLLAASAWLLLCPALAFTQQAISSSCGLRFSMPSSGWRSDVISNQPGECNTRVMDGTTMMFLDLTQDGKPLEQKVGEGLGTIAQGVGQAGFAVTTRNSLEHSFIGAFEGSSQSLIFTRASDRAGYFGWVGAYPAGVGRTLSILILTPQNRMWGAVEIYRGILESLQIESQPSAGNSSNANQASPLTGEWETGALYNRQVEGYYTQLRSYNAHLSFKPNMTYAYSVDVTSDQPFKMTVTGVFSLADGAGGKTLLKLTPLSSNTIPDLELKMLRYEGLPSNVAEDYVLELAGNRARIERYNGPNDRLGGVSREFHRVSNGRAEALPPASSNDQRRHLSSKEDMGWSADGVRHGSGSWFVVDLWSGVYRGDIEEHHNARPIRRLLIGEFQGAAFHEDEHVR